MKKRKLLKALTDIDDAYIAEAAPRKRPRRAAWITATAAVLALAIVGGILLRPGNTPVAAAASYEPDYSRTYQGEALDDAYLAAIRRFAAEAGREMLTGTDSTAYSPTALYTALSMVAELADDSSRQALLDALHASDTAALRAYSGDLWRYLCANPDMREPGKITVANSLWLSDKYTFNGNTLQNLSDYYYVSSYTGNMKRDIPQLVSQWVKKQTNDLLDCQIEPDNDTMAVLLSAIYFYDTWETQFQESQVTDGWFQSPEGEVDCNYLSREEENRQYYQGQGVAAAVQPFSNGGKMLFILPDEGTTPEDVLADTQLVSALLGWDSLEKETGTVDWAIPRFKLSAKLDLEESMKAMGLGSLFDGDNPLSRLSDDYSAYISKAEQGTAISINEKGCEAASYVEIEMRNGSAMPTEEPIYMYLTRPFVFAILSENDVPLFLGTVQNPNG